MAHTPGPWYPRQIENKGIVGFTVDTKDGEIEICEIFPKPQSQVAVKEANAHLISAAPDLLDQIEKQIQWLKYIKNKVGATDAIMIGFDQSIKYLSKVAAKARGK